MRKRLGRHQRKRMFFHASFDHYLVNVDNPKRPYMVFLVKGVRFPDGEKLTGHVWVITKWQSWPQELKGIRKGDTLEFNAEIRSYLKYYRPREIDGSREKEAGWHMEFGLRHPTFVQIFAHKEGAPQPSESETKALQNELNFLVSVWE